ncbi:MAG: hypothetical protein FJY92_12105 [Candidatus Hydrogenedentes bacterium]|nr:hypothetical protein [Candidatus Hydrogenedentota bacterium]
MAEGPVQNYANHTTMDNALTGIAVLALASALLSLSSIFGVLYIGAASPLLMAGGVIWILFRMRAYATRLQDRIIRLETRLRLEHVLPADLAARIGDLELTQLIGLRFASDAELPGLVQQALANPSMKSNDIKKQIKVWQADHLRV